MHRNRTLLAAAAVACLWSLVVVPSAEAQSFGAQGTEFQVNSYTTNFQSYPAVAVAPGGAFMVVWESGGQDGSSYGIFGQRYDAAGAPQGAEFPINTHTSSGQRFPAAAADGAGNFIVVWESTVQDGSNTGVFGQRYDAAGNPLGVEFRVNSFTTGYQERPAVAAHANGDFVVVWQDRNRDQSLTGVFGQRFDASASPQGADFRVNVFTTRGQFDAAVATDGAGNFVVVWASFLQDGSDRGVFGRRFGPSGPLGLEFRVNSFITGRQDRPSVAQDSSGRFVVVWQSVQQDGAGYGVFGRRYDAGGVPQGAEFLVNSYTTLNQSRPATATDGAGNFVVAWQSSQDGSSSGVVAQRYDAAGLPLGAEFQVNSYTTQYQGRPRVAADTDGHFVVVWESWYQATSNTGDIFGQRLGVSDLIFADGFEP
jgi:hypothetical protein